MISRLVRFIVRFLFEHPDWTTYGVLTAILGSLLYQWYCK